MLKTDWKNWRLRRKLAKLQKEYDRIREKARKEKNKQIYEDWYAEKGWGFQVFELEIQQNVSRDLMEQAEKLYLPIPDLYDKSKLLEEGAFGQVLTPEAMADLRAAIRKEKQDRLETVKVWAQILGTAIAALTGLAGAAIGIIAILKK